MAAWLAAVAVAGLVGVGMGAAAAGGTAEPETITVIETVDPSAERALELDEWQEDLSRTAVELDEREQELDEREEAIRGAEDEAAANTITDGIWTVGIDIEPGTYRATDVSADCYWAILATGSNGADIIDNAIPGGGNPTVTLREGQDFETSRCGEWIRQ